MKYYEVEVTGTEKLGEYFILEFRWRENPPEPGQFVMARAAGFPASLDPFLARPLSFYDFDESTKTASLLYEVRGRGTENLAAKKPGDTIEVTAPLGKPFDVSEMNENSRAALLGGGIGIAPFRFLSRHLDEMSIPHDTYLGFANESLAKAASGFENAKVATMDGSTGTPGTVLDALEQEGGIERYDAIYACGPNPMLAAVKLAAPPETRCQLSVEERMACGNGSCNGCVVPTNERGYVRSCIEGPVFDAKVLAW